MAGLSRLNIAVIGAGVLGLSTAWALARAGARVAVYDPSPAGDSASRVAAGMLSPALEAALDPTASGHFQWLRAGRDGWAALLEGADVSPDAVRRSGALFLGDYETTSKVAERLEAMGAEWCWATAGDAESLAPGQASGDEGIFTPEDWLISPPVVLGALERSFRAAGGVIRSEWVSATPHGLERGGAPLEADLVIVAGGMAGAQLEPFVPEVGVLTPIKGQIVHYGGGPTGGAIVRTQAGYVAPQVTGAIAGATMEPGVADLDLKAADLDRMRREAVRLFPGLSTVSSAGRAGLRAATPDGLPMVGRSRSGVILATGARRNGWLWAPLVAQTIVALAAGEDVGPWAAGLNPGRFSL